MWTLVVIRQENFFNNEMHELTRKKFMEVVLIACKACYSHEFFSCQFVHFVVKKILCYQVLCILEFLIEGFSSDGGSSHIADDDSGGGIGQSRGIFGGGSCQQSQGHGGHDGIAGT